MSGSEQAGLERRADGGESGQQAGIGERVLHGALRHMPGSGVLRHHRPLHHALMPGLESDLLLEQRPSSCEQRRRFGLKPGDLPLLRHPGIQQRVTPLEQGLKFRSHTQSIEHMF